MNIQIIKVIILYMAVNLGNGSLVHEQKDEDFEGDTYAKTTEQTNEYEYENLDHSDFPQEETDSDKGKNDIRIPGFQLAKGGETSVCREIPFKKLDEFSFCFFIMIGKYYHDSKTLESRIFTLWDFNYFISLDITFEGIMELNINGTVTYYQRYIIKSKWTKVCLYKEASKLDVALVINYREVQKISAQELEKLLILMHKHLTFANQKNFLNFRSMNNSTSHRSFKIKGGTASVCFQHAFPYKIPLREISVAAASILHEFPQDIEDDNCVRTFKIDQIFELDKETWVLENVTQLSLNISEVCFDTYVIPFIDQIGDYSKHLQLCRHLNGRLLHLEEVEHFEEYFETFLSERKSQPNTTKYFEYVRFWLNEGTSQGDLQNYYSAYSLNYKEISKHSLEYILKYTFCISPSLAVFTNYGSLELCNRKLFLRENDKYSFSLFSLCDYDINNESGKWQLDYSLEKEPLYLDSILPMGRQNWTSTIDETKTLITITHCKEKEFSCTNGICLPWNFRCNGIVECSDKSDEENCIQLEKENGYLTNLPPLPNKKESAFKLYYRVTIINIVDITSKDRSIKMEIQVNLTWYDPRIKFWNIAKNEMINIDDISFPKLSWIGNVHPGFLIVIDKEKSFTSCQSDPTSFETNKTRTFPYKDPYMGTYIKGEDMKILYKFASIIEVPCRFNLEKYPFGKQSCNVAFRPENVNFISNFKFVYEGDNTHSSDLIYNGNRNLGEYDFVSADHKVDNQSFVVVTIHLKNLYGFHLLNSFIPSVLICIVAYSTLIFPLKDSSDRISLSLTSLLVLAALFTQAGSTSVITPYYKLLDIWYVVLIFFCFMIIMYNVLLRKFLSVEERKARETLNHVESPDKNCNFKYDFQIKGKKKLVFCNFLAIIFFLAFFVIFIILFCLAASEII